MATDNKDVIKGGRIDGGGDEGVVAMVGLSFQGRSGVSAVSFELLKSRLCQVTLLGGNN